MSFAANETAKIITVNVKGDTIVEPDETFTVTLSNANNGAVITTATVNGTIRNDDTNLGITATNAVQTEGNTGNKPFTFTVNRTGVTTGTSSVNWAVTGSGTNGANAEDFGGTAFPSGTVSFAANETAKIITVNVKGDTIVEPDETFTVTLSSPTGAAITTATATATGTIENGERTQQITSVNNLSANNTSPLTIPLFYKTSTADDTLTGIAFRLHYNSKYLTFTETSDLFKTGQFGDIKHELDTTNLDKDANTDKYLEFKYFDFNGQWPGESTRSWPLKLADVKFIPRHYFGTTQLKITADNLAPKYILQADPIMVRSEKQWEFNPTWNLDIDGNGKFQPLSDGIMVARYLFGSFPGEELINDAMGDGATRITYQQIQDYLREGVEGGYLDIDGNGETKALSDGIIVMRDLFGSFPGEELIKDAMGNGATRDLAAIQTHLDQLTPL